MNRRILWLIGLLVPVVLIFGGIADRAVVDQARSVDVAALSEADRNAGMAALAVRATLARHEISVVAGERPPGVTVYGVLLSSRQPLSRDSTRAYTGRPASELDDLYKNSPNTTAQGLPEAVVAAVALGTPAAKVEAANRLLSGRLPVHPDDLPYLALALGVGEDPRVELLQARLRGALAGGALPVFPDFRRTLADRGTIVAERVDDLFRSPARQGARQGRIFRGVLLAVVHSMARSLARYPHFARCGRN